MRLQWLDFLATLRERKTWLCGALLLYAVLSMPVVLARPPEHVREVIRAWFGDPDPFVLFMYVWIDLAMNKVVAFLPVVLGSGVVLRERDNGSLPLVASKPLSLPRYFVLRAVSACLVMATLHAATQLLGAAWFSIHVPRFRAATFLLAMIPHLFAAVFATALSAAIATWVGRRGAAALVALTTLGLLVGIALLGFYQPAWRTVSYLNPITLGAVSLASLGHLSLATIAPSVAALSLCVGFALAAGAAGARRMEA